MKNPIIGLLTKFFAKFSAQEKSIPTINPVPPAIDQASPIDTSSPCCGDLVHIAYRGVSDDRLYMAYDRKWQELKFFRPTGLRVYCNKCRQRIY